MKKILSFVLALVLMLTALPVVSINAEGEAVDTIEGAALNIGSSLTLDYFVKTEKENTVMRFTSSSGRVTEAEGVFDEEKGMLKFSYTGINPQCMTDTIKAELLYDGEVIAEKADYSVKAYSDNLVTKKAEELGYSSKQHHALRVLLADTLVYGSASQEYKNYNTEKLADDSTWVDLYESTFVKPAGTRNIEGNLDEENRVTALGVNVANVNKIYFKMTLKDGGVIVKLNGEVIERSDLIELSPDNYVLYTEDIKAFSFDEAYTLTLEKDTVISTVEYNVYAYVEKKFDDADVGGITKALYNYGASAKNYIEEMTEVDNDFDLEEEDDLINSEPKNLLPENASTYETAADIEDTGWGGMGITLKEIVEDDFGKCVHFVRSTAADYNAPLFNIEKYIKHAGIYTISFNYKVEGAKEGASAFNGIIRTSGETTFASASGKNYFLGLSGAKEAVNGQWETYTARFSVEESDLTKTDTMPWRFGMHTFQDNAVTDIYIDNFTITEFTYSFDEEEKIVDSAETWVSEELVLISDKEYEDPFNDVDVDLILTNGKVTYKVPGFWDGGNVWRVRFACTEEGEWTYTTVCTDTENTGLHNKTNTFNCEKYSGDLDIYKHGFVTTKPDTKYFVYADGTPFFYLGDTHWSTGGETVDMVKTITEHRVAQGYNVWQSEPLGTSFSYENGITTMDVVLMQEFDEKFKIIADAGMVHTNTQFFFPSTMSTLINNFGGYNKEKPYTTTITSGETEYTFYDLSDTAKAYLEKISRYWVARYSSYPVMWTLGQEVDNDFYWKADSHSDWSYVNNPYRYVAEYIYKYDPYKNPLTAHQEGHGSTVASDDNEYFSKGTLGSAFRDLEAHTWYATQWKPAFKNMNGQATAAAKDYWFNGQGKPVVLYEGMYCYLWTKNFGARAQGWFAYLSGMFGHGYGAQDTWCYLSTYSESEQRDDGVDVITPEDKQTATWQDALAYESSYQLGYMRDFFEDTVGDWWNLVPRFDDTAFLARETKTVNLSGGLVPTTKTGRAYAYVASKEDASKYVIYFYNFSDASLAENPNAQTGTDYQGNAYDFGTLTGTVGKLQASATYKYKWFNPRTEEYSQEATFVSDASGNWTVPQKETGDMVLYIYK